MSSQPGGIRFVVALPAVLVLCISLAGAQADTRDLDSYRAAIQQPRTADHIAALQRYVAASHGGALRQAALEWLIWDYERTGRRSEAATTANQLLAADPDNALALAALSDRDMQVILVTRGSPDGTLSKAQRGLASLDRMRSPEGMPSSEFGLLTVQIAGVLNGVVGQAYVLQEHYVEARLPLRRAIRLFPDNPQYAYALGVADVLGDDPNGGEGYWYLARAVNLTRDPALRQQISDYARNLYQRSGGTADQWNRFVAAAVTSTQYQAPVTATAQAKPAPKAAAPVAATRAPRQAAKTKPEQTASRRRKSKSEPVPRTDEELPAEVAAVPEMRKPLAPRAGGPISLGILIEATDARRNRKVLLNGLSDIVRHLRPGEEAFILSFGQELEFEQDLTANYRLLERAIDDIKPRSGAALFDAVSFAAGHLKRIARNDNRVLLVISDGRNAGGKTSPLEMAAEIHGVRIYCIGMDVTAAQSKYLLSALASNTGGWASFISDPGQFIAASQQMAQVMGLATAF